MNTDKSTAMICRTIIIITAMILAFLTGSMFWLVIILLFFMD